ncbi:NADH-quinone oxidoreductase subunit B [Neisseria wadsworthii 9715]|uniref:NADH-quinone oxidoreductase subunit B n=1 Tax=Neisseria wadsworthii 9715 TaxID=1030841 RepID=G4CMC3_9NEIS|nr:NADH-quinone oxidoreductase subunit B [Neisseria wadsworthii 9715]
MAIMLKLPFFRIIGCGIGIAIYFLIYQITEWPNYLYWITFLILMAIGIFSFDKLYHHLSKK